MTTSWILVANASEAHLYESPRLKLLHGHTPLTHLAEFAHPESRSKGLHLVTDKLGHSGHGTFVETSEPKSHEAMQFARLLIAELEKGRVNHCFQDLIIVAPPKFHGLLNKCLQAPLQHLLSVDVDKDYTQADEQQLRNYLQDYL